jgi:penicillin-binding protein 2
MLNIPLKDYLRETRVFNTRIGFAAVMLVVLTLILLTRLVWLQVVSHRHYETLAQANRVRPLPILPARGLILDRNGAVLAQNFGVYTLEIVPEQVQNMNELIEEVRKLVRVTDGDLKTFHKARRERPRFEAITLRSHLNEEEAARISVRLPFLNGVELRARLQRHYPLGGTAIHALGYVSRISETDLEKIDKSAYRGVQHIGKLGLEATYEKLLLGTVGFENVETNAHGRSLRTLNRVAPVAGKNLRLHLDIHAQNVAEQALGNRRGAVIALDPRTGGVLAFASTPTYDANKFVNGIDPDDYKALLQDLDKPLINRVINGVYAPGSTIKSFFGLAALEAGKEWDATRPVVCDGSYNLPGSSHQFRDWKKTGHGLTTLHDSVVQSCDIYYYRLAVALGPDRLRDFLAPFGFGKATGVDLPLESNAILPSPSWKQRVRKQPWYPGDTVVVGIGQGLLLATPMQLAHAMGAIATRGKRLKPRMASAYEDSVSGERVPFKPESLPDVTLSKAKHWDDITYHLMAVVHSSRGTAQGIGHTAPYTIAGKTGTAQVKSIAQGARYNEQATPERFRDHALFVSFAPADDPRVAVAVIVENGGSGSGVAAPIARKVMDQIILGRQADPKLDADAIKLTRAATESMRSPGSAVPRTPSAAAARAPVSTTPALGSDTATSSVAIPPAD